MWQLRPTSVPSCCPRTIDPPSAAVTAAFPPAPPQVWDVENEPVMLYVGCEVTQWRDQRKITIEGPPVMKLREAEYLWQTSSYIIWPRAVRTPASRPALPGATPATSNRIVRGDGA